MNGIVKTVKDNVDSKFQFSVFCSRWHPVSLGKAHTRSAPSPSSLSKITLETAPMFVWLNTDLYRSWEDGMSAASFVHSCLRQATNAVVFWPVHVQKVPQASKHLCTAKLQTICDVCYACRSICPFISTDSGLPRGSRCTEVCAAEGLCMAVCQSGQPIPDSTFNESVRKMACVICTSHWETS